MKLKTLFLTLPILLLAVGGRAENFENIPKIVLNGEATIQKDADQMEVTLGVVTRGKESGQAMTQNNQLMNQVIANLARHRIGRDGISNMSISRSTAL